MQISSKHFDVIIIGASAAGLMCAIEAGKRGRRVLVIEHNDTIGKKIRISGGGRCNFTNIYSSSENFISNNPHFCKSALSRFTPDNFISLLNKHGIAYHEKKLGQLFCDGSAPQIIDMLINECDKIDVCIKSNCSVKNVIGHSQYFLETSDGDFDCDSLVIATGGLSIPKIGASNFGYEIAEQFGHHTTHLKPGLVPLVWNENDQHLFKDLTGVSIDAIVRCNNVEFRENILFTHRGLSGPAILQISSYWNQGQPIIIDLLPDVELSEVVKNYEQQNISFSSLLDNYLPKRFVKKWCDLYITDKLLFQYSKKEIQQIENHLHNWKIIPADTEGFEKAEVTVGGVDTKELSSKTMESTKAAGLYFIGEVVDVTGWLGGYNFQWAWSSGWVAGQYV